MNEQDPDLAALDALIEAHPPDNAPAGFPERVMGLVASEPLVRPFWQRDWVQWLAAGVGLALTLGRLVGYILSVWLAVEVAG
ncbi:MAG: hypothetical protein U9Q81_19075 [Pseudomonadota bacterium]|nr:hypothetical protein [Pseudomonadota bacterium]